MKNLAKVIIIGYAGCVFFGIIPSSAQNLNYSWANRIGNTAEDRGYSIVTDKMGNVYTAGNFKGTVDFDPGTGSFPLTADASNGDIYITKFNPAGNFIWAIQFKGKYREDRPLIHLDTLGHIFCAGQFAGDTLDLDPGPGTYYLINTDFSGVDMFVAKLDTSRNLLWAKLLNGDGGFYNYPNAVHTDAAGNVFVSGSFSNTFDFNTGPDTFQLSTVPIGLEDAFVLKLDPNGNFIWAKQMGGNRPDGTNAMELDESGNIYTTGYFGGTADFDPGTGIFNLISSSDYQTFLSKLDAAGNLIWAKQISGLGTSTGYGLLYDQNMSLYYAGGFGGTMDFDPGAGTHTEITPGDYDHFLLKTDTAGNFQWVKRFTGSGGGYTFQLANDTTFNLYLSGSIQDTTDFDPGPGVFNLVSSSGSADVFICKLDSSGNFIWAAKVGGSGNDWIQGLTVDVSHNVYATGYFSGTADFNPGGGTNNLTSAGNDDIFILKLSQSTATGLLKNEFSDKLLVYPNPTKNQFTVDLGNLNMDVVLKISDVSGKEIYSAKYNGSKLIQIELNQPAGIYFLSVLSKDRQAVFKLIRN
jgi:Secretion system C-terminal sorting domain